MEHLCEDLRDGWRYIRRARGSSALIVLLLALGIGLTVTGFGAVNALLLRPLPVREPDELVRLVSVARNAPARSTFSYRGYELLTANSTSFTDAIAYTLLATTEWTDSSASGRLWCAAVSANYFSALGVQALTGRLFMPDDASRPAEVSPAVLSYAYWQRRFHGNPGVVGRPLRLRDRMFTIVGVTPREFNGIQIDATPDVRVPLTAADGLSTHPELGSFRKLRYEVVARRRPGISLEQARTEAENIYRAALEEEFPASEIRRFWPQERFELQPVARGLSLLRDRYRSALLLLAGSAALLLLMICANAGGLLLAGAASRRPETAVRIALGAPAARLLRMALAQSLLLAMSGAGAGLALAWAAAPLLERALPPLRHLDTTQLTLAVDFRPDGRVIIFSFVLCLACALLAGIPAALETRRADLHSALRATRASSRNRLRWGLVAFQAALGTLLVAVSGLLVSTLRELRELDAGFDREHVVSFTADPGMLGYTDAQARSLSARLVQAVEGLPEVQSVAVAAIGLMRGSGMKTTVAPAGQKASPEDYLNTSIHFVSPDYFASMGIRLLGGRVFRADEPERKPESVVVNRAFAERFFPGLDATGRRFGSSVNQIAAPELEIIGIVGDAKYRSLRERVPPTVYYPWRARGTRVFVLHVRTRGRPEALMDPVRRALTGLEPRLPFYEVRTLAEEVDASLRTERSLAWVSLLFAAAAVAIALLGTWGTLAWVVAQRKREIAIRVALGAGPRDIVWACVARPAAFLVFGTAVGLTAFYAAAPLLEGLLYGVSPRDPASLPVAAATMLLLVGAATAAAAATALMIDPVRALREE